MEEENRKEEEDKEDNKKVNEKMETQDNSRENKSYIDEIWTRKIMDEAFRHGDAKMTDRWGQPGHQGQGSPHDREREVFP